MNKLVLELLADSNGLLKGLDRAQAGVEKFTRASDSAGQALGGGVNRALDAFEGLAKGGATAAGVLAGGFVAAATAAVLMTVSAGKQVEAVDQLSQKTGIAVQVLQGWSVIMAENGFRSETLAGSMRTLSKQIVDARDPASAAAASFEQMGISLTQLGSTDSTIRAVADKFKEMPDGADKARLAVTLFGKAGLEMIPMLNRGATAFDESRAASERFGAVLSGQQVSALNAVDDASDRLGVALQGLKLQLAATFAGSVTAGIEAVTNGIARLTNITTNYSAALEQIKKDHPIVASMMPGIAAAMAAAKASNMPPPVPPVSGGPQDSHVAEREFALGQRQEELGTRIRNQLIEKFHLLQAQQHAQEALGKTTLAIIQRETAERNNAFALQLEQAEDLNNQQFAPTGSTASKVLDAQIAAVTNLMQLYPELNAQEAALLAIHNQDHAASTIQEASLAYQHRNDALDEAVAKTKALDDQQSALFRSEAGLFGASDAARRVRFSLIDAEVERKRQAIEEEIFDETRKAEAIQNLTIETETKRRQAIQQFPSFFEQQMQALVNSNSFSMGQMVSTWSGGIAQMVVHGGNLKAAWEQTQVALVQASLNSGASFLANMALSLSQELGLVTSSEAAKAAAMATSREAELAAHTGLEAAKTAITETQDAARMVLAVGNAKAMDALMVASLGSMSVMATAALAMAFAVSQVVASIAYGAAAIMAATPFGQPAAGALIVAATGFEFATGAAIIAAQGAIQGILGTAIVAAAKPFASGGIVTGATLGLVGEAGPEAAIPLNSRGAAFMSDMLGMGSGGEQQIYVMLDGRKIGEAVANRMMDRIYVEVGA